MTVQKLVHVFPDLSQSEPTTKKDTLFDGTEQYCFHSPLYAAIPFDVLGTPEESLSKSSNLLSNSNNNRDSLVINFGTENSKESDYVNFPLTAPKGNIREQMMMKLTNDTQDTFAKVSNFEVAVAQSKKLLETGEVDNAAVYVNFPQIISCSGNEYLNLNAANIVRETVKEDNEEHDYEEIDSEEEPFEEEKLKMSILKRVPASLDLDEKEEKEKVMLGAEKMTDTTKKPGFFSIGRFYGYFRNKPTISFFQQKKEKKKKKFNWKKVTSTTKSSASTTAADKEHFQPFEPQCGQQRSPQRVNFTFYETNL